MAFRYAVERAKDDPDLRKGQEWRVLTAVAVHTVSWSKLEDRCSLASIADAAGMSSTSSSSLKRVGRILRLFADKGVLVYRPGAGERRTVVGFPKYPSQGVVGTGPSTPPEAPTKYPSQGVEVYPSQGPLTEKLSEDSSEKKASDFVDKHGKDRR
jgi:hypothetical protein